MHAYEMSYKCQFYLTHAVATYISVHVVAILIHNRFKSPNICLQNEHYHMANDLSLCQKL
jgi:hypothetical protein